MLYRIHEIAHIAGISVRTLHYYDEIGLLTPSQKTRAGYRIYSEEDIAVLHQIMLLKELGFSLGSIRGLGAKNALTDKSVLISQRQVLERKKIRLEEIIAMLDTMISKRNGDEIMVKKEQFSAFDMSKIEFAQKKYADEVANKYPKHLVEESSIKTAGYSKNDWQYITGGQEDIFMQFAKHLQDNRKANDEKVQSLVLVFQQHISNNFYTCDNACLFSLGELYVSDERFTKYYEKIAPGLAEYIHQAMRSFCKQ